MLRSGVRSIVIVATGLLGLVAIGSYFVPAEGLAASYYANREWASPAAVSTVDSRPSTERLIAAWHGAPPETFSASWAGFFLAWRDGPYTFATVSDDGSWLYVDGRLIVSNGGRHGPSTAQGSTTLTRGVHAIFIQYVQEGGGLHLDLLWGRRDDALAVVPGWALTPRRLTFWRFAVSAAVRLALAGAQWLWVAALVLGALVAVGRATSRAKAWTERQHIWPALSWIVAGSLVLNLAGIWWGLPGDQSWAPDELTPVAVSAAAAQHFSHGWFDRYPPFQFYVVAAAYSPLLLLQWWGRIDLTGALAATTLTLVGRLVSVAAGAGTLIAIYACGARIFGRGAGLCAAAMFALVAPFVYYAKTANVDAPYVFWFAMSLFFYLRALDQLQLRDFLGFAVSGTLAIVTKDQAYGLYLLAPIVLIHRLWQVNRAAALRHPLAHAVLDRRLALAALTAVVLFAGCHNLMFNWRGFVEHVRLITGSASESYRDFAPTVAGRAALALLTMDLVRVSWGWPLFLVGVAGVVVAALTRRYRQPALWIAVPALSYYLGFIDVVLYTYDRFVLPICVVLSIFGGLAIDRWLTVDRGDRAWRVAGAAAVLAYSLLYAATVDVVMLRDSRYRVEEWLAAHVGEDQLIGFVFPLQYYPRLERFALAEITSVSELERVKPVYYLLNADYARAEPATSPIGVVISGIRDGTLGYERAFQFRQPAPWPWLPYAHRNLVGPRTDARVTSSLHHINPTFEVFRRRR